MSRRLISRNLDLQRLENEGFSIEIIGGKLVTREVPYVDADRQVHRDGYLVMPLELAGEVAKQPADHTATFGGGVPCKSDGSPLSTVVNSRAQNDLGDGLVVMCTCSMKPVDNAGRYEDFYEKVTKYVAAITGHAAAIDPSATAAVFHPIVTREGDSPFRYANTASSRAGIDAINAKLRSERVAIVGLGGTGAYIFDFVAKTEVAEIHVFDDDKFRSHNAFRGPGAPTVEELNDDPLKVDHFGAIYERMRTGIVLHPFMIDDTNVHELETMTFVFIAIDDATAKEPIVTALLQYGLPFVDVGMGVDSIDGRLSGSLRSTIATPEKHDHVAARVPLVDTGGVDDYKTNIQIAELNARNATDAVIAWKKYRGFYANLSGEHSTVYTIATNHIINSDNLDGPRDEDAACA